MRVKCVSNRGKDLPQKLIDSFMAFPESEFNLTIGNEYTVYAISIWRNSINYLIVTDDAIDPSWEFADLFYVVDHKLPSSWYFQYFENIEGDKRMKGLMALWGFNELIENKEFYINLLEVEPLEVAIFNKRKEEIDAEA
jgi:hypothetical protein